MSGPNGDPDISIDDGIEIDDEDEFSEGEYVAINSMLDQINSCLDNMEERNDSLNGKLYELLESNRQARQEFRTQLNAGSTTPPMEEQAPTDKDSSPPTEGEPEEGDTGEPA